MGAARTFDLRANPIDATLMRFMDRVTSDCPHGQTIHCMTHVHAEELLPDPSSVIATWKTEDGFDVLAESGNCVVHIDEAVADTGYAWLGQHKIRRKRWQG